MFRSTAVVEKIFRGNMISKRGNKNFYKGRGAPTMGNFTKRGSYIIDEKKFHKLTFRCPDLVGFPLKAYVARTTPKNKVTIETQAQQVAPKENTEQSSQ